MNLDIHQNFGHKKVMLYARTNFIDELFHILIAIAHKNRIRLIVKRLRL